MNFEETLKDDLARLSDDVTGGPDLGRTIETGRRRRRTRQLWVGAASGAAVVMIAATAVALAPGGGTDAGRPTRSIPQPAAPVPHQKALPQNSAPVDFVAGTQVDEQIQTALTADLPAGLDVSDVYPSDWNHDTPIADAQAENATDWEAYYATGATDTVRVVIGLPDPGEHGQVSCGRDRHCTQHTLADGSTLTTQDYNTGATYFRNAILERADGKTVVASDIVDADSQEEAAAGWMLSSNQLVALATSSGLDFPDPVHPPSGH